MHGAVQVENTIGVSFLPECPVVKAFDIKAQLGIKAGIQIRRLLQCIIFHLPPDVLRQLGCGRRSKLKRGACPVNSTARFFHFVVMPSSN